MTSIYHSFIDKIPSIIAGKIEIHITIIQLYETTSIYFESNHIALEAKGKLYKNPAKAKINGITKSYLLEIFSNALSTSRGVAKTTVFDWSELRSLSDCSVLRCRAPD